MRSKTKKRCKLKIAFVPTAVELDWLDETVERHLCELDSLFALTESEWLACLRRLRRCGMKVLQEIREGKHGHSRKIRGLRIISSEVDGSEDEADDISVCIFGGDTA